MEWLTQISSMRAFSARARRAAQRVGLVPTMGALHEGHLSLVRRARDQCDLVVVSIFVNPTQFGPTEDYRRYPRNAEQDLKVLGPLGVDAVFAPEAGDVYPPGFDTWVEPGPEAEPMEGESRPGHFRGVATVVLKLLNIVQPQAAYFGQKDYQQMVVVRRMVSDLNLEIDIVVGPIVREKDGLALSSRNVCLKGEDRKAARVLSCSLKKAETLAASGERNAEKIVAEMKKIFAAEPRAQLDYAEIVDSESLESVKQLRPGSVALVAARVGPTRLIDNTILEIT